MVFGGRLKIGSLFPDNYIDEADDTTVNMAVDCHFMTHRPKIPSQNGVQKPMSAKILQLLIILTLIPTIWWPKIVSYILLEKQLYHFGIIAESVILENQDTRVEYIITMQMFEARYLKTLAF